MKIIAWIIANWDSVAILLVALIGFIVYIRKNGIKAIKLMLFAWVTQVEAEYGGETGILKRSEVAAKIYEKLPTILKLLLSVNTISKLLEKGLEEAKGVWASNEAINNYITSIGSLVIETTKTIDVEKLEST